MTKRTKGNEQAMACVLYWPPHH